jgi:hypothetical protein
MSAAIIFVDISLSFASGESPRWLPPLFGTDRFNDFENRVTQFEDMKRSGQVRDDNLVAVLGLSQVRHDMDPRALSANDPRHRDWLVLGTEGRNFRQIALPSRVLIHSQLRPAMVVLMLAFSQTLPDATDSADQESPRMVLSHLRHRQFWQAARDCSWLVRHRLFFLEEATILHYEFARRVRDTFGLPMSVTYTPQFDPFAPWPKLGRNGDLIPSEEWEGRKEMLVASNFVHMQNNLQALAALVRELRANGARVVVVLAPETSRLRKIYPLIAPETFNKALVEASNTDPLPVFDLRAVMPDAAFGGDDAHLNSDGREEFSAKMPALLEQAPTTEPLR